jgi:hypothetical protein
MGRVLENPTNLYSFAQAQKRRADMSAGQSQVYLLVGPRAAGKSHYATRLYEANPQAILISRDEILMREFGTIYGNGYTGEHVYAVEMMYRQLQEQLRQPQPTTIILDCWTGDSHDRIRLVRKLRDMGAKRVLALFFVTPLQHVSTWFWLKPEIARMDQMGKISGEGIAYFSPEAPANLYRVFHHFAMDIDADGFDEVIRVHPVMKLIRL